MERLTERGLDFTDDFVKGEDIGLKNIALCLDRLQKYEDMEEQGKFLRASCSVGDKVWAITRPADYSLGVYSEAALKQPHEKKIYSITFSKNGTLYHVMGRAYCEADFGRVVFFTKEEAERAIAENLYKSEGAKRLTEKGFNFTEDFIGSDISPRVITQCLAKLQKYEDLEESGLLVEFPCRIGDTAYVANKSRITDEDALFTEEKVRDIQFRGDVLGDGSRFCMSIGGSIYFEREIGTLVFLTKEDAENTLKKGDV